jgi:copper transport protein
MCPARLLRLLVMAAVAGAWIVATAAPAAAHATLQTSNPADGAVLDRPPPEIALTFDEPVEIPLGSVRLFDCAGARVDAGEPRHAPGSDEVVVAAVPDLAEDTYRVTWRVLSADAHPISGAFSFTVGAGAAPAECAVAGESGAGPTIGTLFWLARVLVFAGLALLIGGGTFAVVIARGTSAAARARMVMWSGWVVLVVATLAAILLQGPYALGTGAGDIVKWSVTREILRTTYGEVALERLVVLAIALIPMVFLRRTDGRARLPAWGLVLGGTVAVALAATPALAGHADAGSHRALAVLFDTLHVLAMSVWLGGLVALLAGALGGAFSGGLRRALVSFSTLALWCVIVLVVTGVFASWRQVGFQVRGFTDTSFGNILLVKLGFFGLLVAVAAFSRTMVRRRPSVPLDAPGSVVAAVDQRTVAVLQSSVAWEVALGAIVLAVTALLVQAVPARTAVTPPLFAAEVSVAAGDSTMLVDVVVDPARTGSNTMHITTLQESGRAFPVSNIDASLALPARGIDRFAVPLRKVAPNHWLTDAVPIVPAGKWTLQIYVTRGRFTSITVPPIEVPIR